MSFIWLVETPCVRSKAVCNVFMCITFYIYKNINTFIFLWLEYTMLTSIATLCTLNSKFWRVEQISLNISSFIHSEFLQSASSQLLGVRVSLISGNKWKKKSACIEFLGRKYPKVWNLTIFLKVVSVITTSCIQRAYDNGTLSIINTKHFWPSLCHIHTTDK